MTITISSEDPRSIRAVKIAAGAAQWLKCRTRYGQKAYGIPSQSVDGRFYLVTCERCDCPDAQRHADEPCKRVLAVRLHVGLIKGTQHLPQRRSPLQARRHADGEVTWERHEHSNGDVVYLPRPPRCNPSDDNFKRFEGH